MTHQPTRTFILQPLNITSSQWLSSHYLSELVKENKAIAFTEEVFSFYEYEGTNESLRLLTVIGQSLSLEKLWHVWRSLKVVLPINCFLPRISAIGVSFYAPLSEYCEVEETVLKHIIEKVTEDVGLDITYTKEAPALSQPGLLVMDMDSTMIQIECIDEIARLAGVGEQVSQVTAQAMRGEIDFAESLVKRVECLKGTPVDVLEQICERLLLMPGLDKLVTTLQKSGWKIAIASGGFTFFADYLKERLNLDAAVSNTLEIKKACLTGRVVGRIIDAQVKAETVVNLAKQFGIDKSQTIAMGDGANDLVMMQHAALGVGCHAKPVVRQQADCFIRYAGLDGLLAILGD